MNLTHGRRQDITVAAHELTERYDVQNRWDRGVEVGEMIRREGFVRHEFGGADIVGLGYISGQALRIPRYEPANGARIRHLRGHDL